MYRVFWFLFKTKYLFFPQELASQERAPSWNRWGSYMSTASMQSEYDSQSSHTCCSLKLTVHRDVWAVYSLFLFKITKQPKHKYINKLVFYMYKNYQLFFLFLSNTPQFLSGLLSQQNSCNRYVTCQNVELIMHSYTLYKQLF